MSKCAWCSNLTAPYLIIVTHSPKRTWTFGTSGGKLTFAATRTKARYAQNVSLQSRTNYTNAAIRETSSIQLTTAGMDYRHVKGKEH
jgi:hypothetical protein